MGAPLPARCTASWGRSWAGPASGWCRRPWPGRRTARGLAAGGAGTGPARHPAALRLLHQPPDDSDPAQLEARTTPAHRRLASEELFAFALGVTLRRAGRLARRGQVVPTTPELRERLKDYLPFRLTGAQRQAFREIVADLTSGRVMHRLLQGDVGSGKTLVAFLAMAMVAETGGQAALLVPTEVLARQHAATLRAPAQGPARAHAAAAGPHEGRREAHGPGPHRLRGGLATSWAPMPCSRRR